MSFISVLKKIGTILLVALVSYLVGKRNADKWYWQHPKIVNLTVPAPVAPDIYPTNIILGMESDVPCGAVVLRSDGSFMRSDWFGWTVKNIDIDSVNHVMQPTDDNTK